MSLILTRETLGAAYDLLELTAPFDKWNLPPSEEVKFVLTKDKHRRAECMVEGPDYTISVSAVCIGRLDSLLESVAHEMVHLHMWRQSINEKDYHGPGFRKLAGQVCKVHGFDPKLF